jgi:hypothetical protein
MPREGNSYGCESGTAAPGTARPTRCEGTGDGRRGLPKGWGLDRVASLKC